MRWKPAPDSNPTLLPGQALQLYVDKATAGDRLETIRPGDIIREECVKDKRGILKALSIRLVRSAPKEIGTPEL